MNIFDTPVFNFIYSIGQKLHSDWLIVFLATYLAVLMSVAFLYLIIKQPGLKKKIYFINLFILTELLSRGIFTEIIRFFFPRQRPFVVLPITNLITDNSSSFPSGHSAYIMALALVVYAMNKKWGWTFIGLSILVGLGRIMAGVHWPTDILGGFAVGAISFYLLYYFILPPKKLLASKPKEVILEVNEETKNPQ